jgi:hypothetical protein
MARLSGLSGARRSVPACLPGALYSRFDGFAQLPFHLAYEIFEITGVDVLPEAEPVDIHLSDDQTCGKLSDSPALAFAHQYPPDNGEICMFLFEYAQGFNGKPYSPEVAVRLDQQTIFIHEYLHLVFNGRIPKEAGALHDLVTPLGIYIGQGLAPDQNPCTVHPQTPPGDYKGRLFENLCTQNGFSVDKLAAVMTELDALYQSGGGQVQSEGYLHPVPSALQFREILDRQLGSDTRQAFIDACWPAQLFGDDYQLSEACPPAERPRQRWLNNDIIIRRCCSWGWFYSLWQSLFIRPSPPPGNRKSSRIPPDDNPTDAVITLMYPGPILTERGCSLS